MTRSTLNGLAALSALLGALALSGCATKHLVYVQEVSMGLVISIGTEGTQRMSFGYDRDIYAVVPNKCEGGDETCTKEVMSLLSINRAEITNLSDMTVSEFVATGKPATELAKHQQAVNALRNNIYGAGAE